MFFTLAKSPDSRLPLCDKFGDWFFSHDFGWIHENDTWHKGYNHESIDYGNYASLELIDNTIILKHDNCRSFPLWWDQDTKKLTNFLGDSQRIWADETIVLGPKGIDIAKVEIFGIITNQINDIEYVTDTIVSDLYTKMNCLKNDYSNTTKRFYASGGIDTTLLLAVADSVNLDYEHIDYFYFKHDWFTDNYLSDIKKSYWAYGQLHHWEDPCILLTGTPGDEFTFRGPITIGIWAAWHDIDLLKLLDQSSGYHVGYFLKEKNIIDFKNSFHNRNLLKEKFPNHEDLVRHLLDVNANDHQHWHLGETLTWSPYKDLELTKLILSLSVDDIITQILDASISKQVITKLSPSRLHLISETKNKNSRQNLHRL